MNKYTLKELVRQLNPHLEEDEVLTLYMTICKRKERGDSLLEALLKPVKERSYEELP